MADFKKLRVWNKAHALEYHILLARDLGAIPEPEFEALMRQVVDIKRMLHGLIEGLSAQ